MQHCDYFDYWGSGTQVTVTSEATASPTLFPLVQCNSGTQDNIIVGCLARDFYPNGLTFQWTDDSNTTLTSMQYPTAELNNKYTGVSLVQVSKSDWESRKPFTCYVTHVGSPNHLKIQTIPELILSKVTLVAVPSDDTQTLVCMVEDSVSGTNAQFQWKKNGSELTSLIETAIKTIGGLHSAASVLKVSNTDWDSKAVYTCEVTYKGKKSIKTTSKALVTVTLHQPSPKEIFNNNQAELKCVITGADRAIVNGIKITWQIDGQTVTDNIKETQTSEGNQYSKTSLMTRSRTEWQGVKKVRCSAAKDDMTPVIQDLTVHKGDGKKPKVAVHILPQVDNNKGDEVTLVCLVSSPTLQDYYIAWSEYTGTSTGPYTDGINFPPQKTQHGYSVTSVYIITKQKWESSKFMCSAWPAGNSNQSMESQEVSKAQESNLSCALSCTEDATEEDELSSLWSTTSSFIFLFISTLFYSLIFSLVKMKRQ